MKRMLPGVMTLYLAACSPPPVETDSSADEARIRAMIQHTADLNNAADTLGWVALFEEGAVYMPPGSAIDTEDGLRAAAALGFGGYQAAITIEPVEIVVLGEWAFVRSLVTGTVTPRSGGDAIPVDVKQLVIYHKQPDGTWKIARFMSNRNP